MEIKLYSAEWCPSCVKVKNYLDNNEVVYEYVDMDTEEGQQAAQELRLRSIPFAIVNGKVFPSSDQIIEEVKSLLNK